MVLHTCTKVFRTHYKVFLGVTVFVGIFSAVYEHYGHGVMSNAMIYAFLYPLILGVLPTVIMAYVRKLRKVVYAGEIRAGANLLYSGAATLTVGSLVSGVVKIFGTTYHLLKYYYYAGIVLAFVGGLFLMVGLSSGRYVIRKKQ